MKRIFCILYFYIISVFSICNKNFILKNNITFLNFCNINNDSLIRNLNCNGEIIFSQQPNDTIYINILNLEESKIKKNVFTFLSGIFISSLPLIKLIDAKYFILIDNNNKLYVLFNDNVFLDNIKKNQIKKNFSDDDLISNIETDTINSNLSPIIINSQNKLLNDIDIKIGNSKNNIIILSKLIFNINELSFNDTINYPINCNENVTVIGNLEAEGIVINNDLIFADQNTINFNNIFINGNLNNNSTVETTLIQGDIFWNNNIKLGNSESDTNYIFNSLVQLSNTSNAFFVLDSNNIFYISSQYPSIEILQINSCLSDSDINIYPLNNFMDSTIVGNNVGNIFFRAQNINFANDILTQNENVNIFVTDDLYIQNGKINFINSINNIIGNGVFNINGNINYNNVAVTNNIFLLNLPIIKDPVGYVGLIKLNDTNNQNILGGILSNTFLKNNETKFHKINCIEKKIYNINIELKIIINEYLKYQKKIKKLLNQLYTIKKKHEYLKIATI